MAPDRTMVALAKTGVPIVAEIQIAAQIGAMIVSKARLANISARIAENGLARTG